MNNPLPFTPDMGTKPGVVPFFDEATNTFSYIVNDPGSNACAVVDCVINLDYASGTISFESADQIIAYILKHDLDLQWILETHVHADHLSAAPYFQERMGGKLGIGENITVVQETFGKVFNEGTEFRRDGSQFDTLFKDGDRITIGNMFGYTLHTPGHTPACMTYVFGDVALVGDTLFMPDSGTARADFPGGDARELYNSIQRVLTLPGETRLFMCHDYCANGSREVAFETTVEAERTSNIHVSNTITEDEFVNMREQRDATLDMPKLILPSLQINMRAGHLPSPETDGQVFLKVPVNAFT